MEISQKNKYILKVILYTFSLIGSTYGLVISILVMSVKPFFGMYLFFPILGFMGITLGYLNDTIKEVKNLYAFNL